MRTLCVLLLSAIALCADVTGRWSGSMVSKNGSGATVSDPFFLILRQDGDRVQGTAGPDELRQLPLRSGKIEGVKLTFEIVRGESGGPTLQFNLTVSGDRMDGELTVPGDAGPETGRLSLKRVPSGSALDVHTLLKSGAEALRGDEFDTANKYFEQALVQQPDFVDARLYLAASHYRRAFRDLNHPDLAWLTKAAEIFQDLLKLDSGNLEIRMYLASILFYQADFGSAKALYRKVTEIDPRKWQAFYGIAAIDYREAHERLMAARDAEPRRDLQARIGPLYDDAIDALAHAARLDPENDALVDYRYACMRDKAELAAGRDAMDRAKQWAAKAHEAARVARNRPRTAEEEAQLRKAMTPPEIVPPPGWVVPAWDVFDPFFRPALRSENDETLALAAPGGHCETNAKPPGGSYQVTFTSRDSMLWHDVNFGGNVTYRLRR